MMRIFSSNKQKATPSIVSLFLIVIYLLVPGMAYSAKEHIQVIAPWELKSPDPAKSGAIFSRMQIIETLIDVNHQGKMVPGVATAWKTTEDGLQWTFTLREGVQFHDNSQLTAASAASALNIAATKPGLLQKAPIKDITHSEKNIIISLTEPYAILDAALTHYTAAILSPAAYEKNGEVSQLIGTGPYQLVSLAPPQKLVVRAFEGYWGDKPAIKSAEYLAVARNETRVLMAESGDADISYTLDSISLKRLQKKDNLKVAAISLPRTIVIKLNCALPVLNDPQLRKALSDGIDREGIAFSVMRLKDATAYQLFPKALGKWHLDALNHKPVASPGFKELLVAQGWKENKQGYMEKDGKHCEFTMLTYSDRPELPIAATALQDQMRKMGIKLNVSVTNSSGIPLGHANGSLEMGLLARNYGLMPTPLGTILQDYGPTGGDWGAMNWSNEKMQKTLNELQQISEPEKQTKYIETIAEILNQEMPTIPVISYLHTAAVNHEIEGFSLDPLERSYRLSELHWKK